MTHYLTLAFIYALFCLALVVLKPLGPLRWAVVATTLVLVGAMVEGQL